MIAISTACKEALISIDVGGKQNFKSLDSNCKHSENMLFTIDKMLDEMGASIQENDTFAVVVGPGSFTGLRIGISLLKGLCAGNVEKNIVPITTFDLMAYSYIKNNAPEENFTCILNGLSGYYFICEYSKDGQKLSQEMMITKDKLNHLYTLVGLKEENLGSVQLAISAEELLQLANKLMLEQKLCSADELCPMYLRKSQAEAELERKGK